MKSDLLKQLVSASADLQVMHAAAMQAYRKDVADAIRAAADQIARAIGHLVTAERKVRAS